MSGHLLQYRFPDSHRSWQETPIHSLFDAPLYKDVIPGMEDIKRTLIEEVRDSDVTFFCYQSSVEVSDLLIFH